MTRSNGVTFWAVIIFINCLWSILFLLNTPWYWYLFQYLPPSLIMFRYVFSLGGRILLMTADIGIWQLKNWGRILAIALFMINILTLPWKHPPQSFENSFSYFHILPRLNGMINELIQANVLPPKINLSSLSSLVAMTFDLILNAALILFFTRKKVVEQFH